MNTQTKLNKTKLNKIKDLNKNGVSLPEACKQVGMSLSNYYYWASKNKAKKRVKISKIELVDAPKSSKVMLVIGSVHDVLEAARGLV